MPRNHSQTTVNSSSGFGVALLRCPVINFLRKSSAPELELLTMWCWWRSQRSLPSATCFIRVAAQANRSAHFCVSFKYGQARCARLRAQRFGRHALAHVPEVAIHCSCTLFGQIGRGHCTKWTCPRHTAVGIGQLRFRAVCEDDSELSNSEASLMAPSSCYGSQGMWTLYSVRIGVLSA
jgi:hypothetical protein